MPRIIGLDVFLTPDEKLLFENSTDYLLGLLRGDLGATFGWGYPGATTMALGAGGIVLRYLLYRAGWVAEVTPGLSLADFAGAVLQNPVESVGLGRLLVVLVVALGLVAFYWLARRLVGESSAFVAALLLALDPYILGYSRLLHNDILMTVFMTLSLLALLVYFREERRGYLLLSGAMGGLALVTKTQALYLPAFVVLAVLLRERRRPLKALAELAAWFAVMALVFWACWPTMWADPLGTLGKTATRLTTEMQKGYGHRGNYFMGTISDDPGPLFYPVVFAFKGTLLLHLGLAAGLVWLLRGTPGATEAEDGAILARLRRRWLGAVGAVSRRRNRQQELAPTKSVPELKYTHTAERATLFVLVVYTLLYMLSAFISAQKSPRYFLPVYPALALLAARGLLWLASPLKRARALAVAALLLQGALIVLFYHPYYFTYHNPLFGGGKQAAKIMMVGWGEGLDRAARYLNGKPQAEELSATSWYEWDFGSFFAGTTHPLVDREASLRADYVVFYVNQVQRLIPDEHFVSYFRQREPEQVITMKGIEYAWIYAGPVVGSGDGPPCQHPVNGDFGGLVRLVCYEPGQARDDFIPLTLYWRATAPLPVATSVFLRLRDEKGNIHGRSERVPVDGMWPVEQWEAGSLIRDDHLLAVRPGTPPGEYLLEVGLYDPSPGQALAASGGKLGPEGGIIVGSVIW